MMPLYVIYVGNIMLKLGLKNASSKWTAVVSGRRNLMLVIILDFFWLKIKKTKYKFLIKARSKFHRASKIHKSKKIYSRKNKWWKYENLNAIRNHFFVSIIWLGSLCWYNWRSYCSSFSLYLFHNVSTHFISFSKKNNKQTINKTTEVIWTTLSTQMNFKNY